MGDQAMLPGGGWTYQGLLALQRAPPQPSCQSLPSPSGQPCSPHPETPPPVKAAAQASGLQDGGGGGWLTTLGMGLDDPGTPPPTTAAAPASGLQDGGGGGLADHVGDMNGRSRDTSVNQVTSPGLWSPGGRWVGWPHCGGVGTVGLGCIS